jgi:hypothetical protein
MGIICNNDELIGLQRLLLVPFNSLWDDINACSGLTAQQKRDFDWELASFRAWINAPIPFCNADAELRAGRDFLAKYHRWRELIAQANCTTGVPDVGELDPNDPRRGSLIERVATGQVETPLDKLNSILKTAAIVGGIGLAAYGLYLTAPLVRGWAASRSTK